MTEKIKRHIRFNTPIKLSIPNEIITSIKASADHTYCITSSGNVYCWGQNNSKQLINDQQIVIKQPTLIPELSKKGILKIRTGTSHSYAWSDNQVFIWGSNQNGKLGQNFDIENIQKPEVFDILTEALNFGWKVVDIQCGENHSMSIISIQNENQHFENRVFVWGSNHHWELGLNEDMQEEQIFTPHELESLKNISVVQAGKCFSIAIDHSGKVFSWGSGEFGRLGYQTETKQQRIPRSILQVRLIQIALGTYHCIGIEENTNVFVWGRNAHGQLGIDHFNNIETPTLNSHLTNISQVAAGENHSIFLDYEKRIFSCGSNQIGQLGITDCSKSSIPLQIKDFQANFISCGNNHNCALSQSGLYVWGSNEYYQMGQDIKKKEKDNLKELSNEKSIEKSAEKENNVRVFTDNDKLRAENYFLTQRVKELERKQEQQEKQEEQQFEQAHLYLQGLEQIMENERIYERNFKIDQIDEELKKQENFHIAHLMHRMIRILKKGNTN